MAHTSERTRFIHKFHDPAAMHIAEDVGVFGMHQLRNADA
jgi:hypothetical protein